MGNTLSSHDDTTISSSSSSSSIIQSSQSQILSLVDEESGGFLFHILKYCDWNTRHTCLFLNKTFFNLLTTPQAYHFYLKRLHEEHFVYHTDMDIDMDIQGVSRRRVPVDDEEEETKKKLFLEMFHRRHIWISKDHSTPSSTYSQVIQDNDDVNKKEQDEKEKKDFKMCVCVRFKPFSQEKSTKTTTTTTLPLHQRLALIKMSLSSSSSSSSSSSEHNNKKALKILQEQGQWFSGTTDTTTSHTNDIQQQQQQQNQYQFDIQNGIQEVDTQNGRVLMMDSTRGLRQFQYNHVFHSSSSSSSNSDSTSTSNSHHHHQPYQQQQDIYLKTTHKIVCCDVMNGYNGLILVYGQTGSGKTFTMFGPNIMNMSNKFTKSANSKNEIEEEEQENNSSFQSYQSYPSSQKRIQNKQKKKMDGIVPRACQTIYQAIQTRYKIHKIEAQICVSYVEVYGNDIFDLLRNGKRVGSNNNNNMMGTSSSSASSQRFVLSGQCEVEVYKTPAFHFYNNKNNMRRTTTTTIDETSTFTTNNTDTDTDTDNDDSLLDFHTKLNNIFRNGEYQKRKAHTAMNDRSSRAHSLFIVTIRQMLFSFDLDDDSPSTITNNKNNNNNNYTMKESKLFLCDLGGSEQTKKSQIEAGKMSQVQDNENNNENNDNNNDDDDEVEETTTTPKYSFGFVQSDRMREAVNINLGLLSLKNCIDSLRNKQDYIPYYNSKLTMLLSPGLSYESSIIRNNNHDHNNETNSNNNNNNKAGNTCIIVCASQDPTQFSESLSALRFGEACTQITRNYHSNDININNNNKGKNELPIIQTMISNKIKKIDQQISDLELLIQQKERWEIHETKRQDNNDDDDSSYTKKNREEIVKTTVLVGAEKERVQLNQLLDQRMKLTGGVTSSPNKNTSTSTTSSTTASLGNSNSNNNIQNTMNTNSHIITTSTEDDEEEETNNNNNNIIGFGNAHAYGLGEKYDVSKDESCQNERFCDDEDNGKGGKTKKKWKTAKDLYEDPQELSKRAKTIDRNSLVYSGISA